MTEKFEGLNQDEVNYMASIGILYSLFSHIIFTIDEARGENDNVAEQKRLIVEAEIKQIFRILVGKTVEEYVRDNQSSNQTNS